MTNHCKTGFIFPPYVIPALALLRGECWAAIIQEIESKPDHSIEIIAFTHMMAGINNCHTCNSDSFRAMNGCMKCSSQSINRFRGSDSELHELYQISKNEVSTFQRKDK